jgi:hypothetical protein
VLAVDDDVFRKVKANRYQYYRSLHEIQRVCDRECINIFCVDGYIWVKDHGVWIKRCALVMEKKLGRKLARGETVHHKNKIKSDDDELNLELLANASDHYLVHDRVSK